MSFKSRKQPCEISSEGKVDRIMNFTLSLIDDSKAVLKVGRANVI